MINNIIHRKRLRYLIAFVVFITSAAFVLSLHTSIKIRGFFIENSKFLLENNVLLLKQSVEQFYIQAIDNVSLHFRFFRNSIYENGNFSLDKSSEVVMEVEDQTTSLKHNIKIPLMLYNDKPVMDNSALMDHFVKSTNTEGLTSTVFQVVDQGLLRISTNLLTPDKKYAVGTFIPASSPVYNKVMKGERYIGRAYVVGKWYWAIYEPITSENQIIGVLYMGLEEDDLTNILEKTFMSVRIGLSGYPFLQDDKGNILIHPFDAGKNMSHVATPDGKVIFDIMRAQKDGWVEYKYPKQGSRLLHDKVTRFMTIESLGWIVGAGAYEDEFYTGFTQYEITYSIFVIVVILVVGSGVGVTIFNTNRKLLDQSEQLQKLAVDAEEANIAKSAFLANMSHEIRTPLNSIMGFSDLLCASDINANDKEYALTISQSARSLLSIINDILDISKIESGKVELFKEEFDLNLMLDYVIKMISVRASEKDINFLFYCDTNIPAKLIGDSERIQQVLMNLLGNAVKFTEKGGEIRLSVFMADKADDTVDVRFEVHDTGIGISEAAVAHIFEPFHQADAGINRKYGGTGLGLTICNKILHIMESEIRVYSSEGVGSTFDFTVSFEKDEKHIKPLDNRKKNTAFCIYGSGDSESNTEKMVANYLRSIGDVVYYNDYGSKEIDILFCFDPLKLREYILLNLEQKNDIPVVFVGEENSLDAEASSMVSAIISHPVYPSKIYNIIMQLCGIGGMYSDNAGIESIYSGTVLVAEDNHTNQLLMKILLEGMGVNVVFAADGKEALEYCSEQTPDLVLMDINMPVMDGVSAFREIKKARALAGEDMVPVVALTANAVKSDRDSYLQVGMDDYLSKPVNKDELHRVLKKYLKVLKTRPAGNFYKNVTHAGQAYDKQTSIRNVGISEKDYDMIISQLFQNLDNDMKMLEDAVSEGDAKNIYCILHYLKGAAMNLHISTVIPLLEEYCTKAKSGDIESFDTQRIRALFEQVKDKINA